MFNMEYENDNFILKGKMCYKFFNSLIHNKSLKKNEKYALKNLKKRAE